MADVTQAIVSLGNMMTKLSSDVSDLQQKIGSGLEVQPIKSNSISDDKIKSFEERLNAFYTERQDVLSKVKDIVKEEIAKDRAAMEANFQLRMEHYITKCVKERLELSMHTVRTQLDEKLSGMHGQIESMKHAPQIIDTSIPPQLQSQPTQAILQDMDHFDIQSLTDISLNDETNPIDIQIRKKTLKKR